MAILAVAALGAGMLNTIAGGGSFLTFPALVFTGYPVVVANATSAVAVMPGHLGGALGFRHELATIGPGRLLGLLALAFVGGLLGALLLVFTPARLLDAIVPWLILVATLVFAASDRLAARLGPKRDGSVHPGPGLFTACVYGGYFAGGLGILLMAIFAAGGMRDLNLMNGLKSIVSFVVCLVSVATFALAGVVSWPAAILMMAAATAGGYLGAHLARAMPRRAVRVVVILIGGLMSLAFFLRA